MPSNCDALPSLVRLKTVRVDRRERTDTSGSLSDGSIRPSLTITAVFQKHGQRPALPSSLINHTTFYIESSASRQQNPERMLYGQGIPSLQRARRPIFGKGYAVKHRWRRLRQPAPLRIRATRSQSLTLRTPRALSQWRTTSLYHCLSRRAVCRWEHEKRESLPMHEKSGRRGTWA